MSKFTIYPAIDLRAGRVVRLKQGDPTAQTIYSDDPVQVATNWLAAGADWLHVVNLDSALGESVEMNLVALENVRKTCAGKVHIQFGGGLRAIEAIERVIRSGVSRTVIGTAAIADPAFTIQILQRFGPEFIAFALDSNHGQLMTQGWQHSSNQNLSEYARFLADCGAKYVIYTDVRRDGMGRGVDWQTAKKLAVDTGLSVIASGGVASLTDVKLVKAAGLSGVIIGRALYENQLSLEEALDC